MSEQQETNWRKAFEIIGSETLRLRLKSRPTEFSPYYARAAQIWLLEQDANKKALQAQLNGEILVWTIVGTLVAMFAAALTLIIFV
jgi:hypothetical protein